MIIGLVGPIASGKGEAVNILTEAGFTPFSLSEEVRREARSRKLVIKREVLVDLGNELRSNEPEYFARKVSEGIIASGASHAVIDGIRNPAEAICLIQNLNMILIALDAPDDVRLSRYLERNRGDDGKTEEDFYRQNQQDLGKGESATGQQVAKCIAMANIHLTNDTDLETFKTKLLELLNHF